MYKEISSQGEDEMIHESETKNTENVILNEEEVEVHLPASSMEEEGVSFKDEHNSVENEEEVEAHLPESNNEDGGTSFRDEDHQDIERYTTWRGIDCVVIRRLLSLKSKETTHWHST